MAEEQSTGVPVVATGEGTAPTDVAPVSPAPAAAPVLAETVDLGILDRIDPDALRKHPRVAGIVGELVQRAQTRWRGEQEETARARAAEDAERQLLELAEKDPITFSERFLKDRAKERVEREKQVLRSSTLEMLGKQVSQAVTAMPEWQEYTQEALETLSRVLAGKSDDDALAAYTAAAVDFVAGKRAEKRFKVELEKALAREKAAWRTDWEAERLAREPAPDIARGQGRPGRIDPTSLPDREFDKWYRENVLSRM